MISLKNRFCLATLALLSAHASFLQGAGNEAAFLQDIEKQASQLAAPQSPLRLDAATSHDLEDARSPTNHGPSAARGILSAAVYPLDLMKKASLCVIKSPWIFLTATSALMPHAYAAGRHPTVYEPVYRGERTGVNATQYPPPLVREPQYYKTDFGLADAWDTSTCKGRALNATHKKAFEDKKDFCRDLITCMPRIVACNDRARDAAEQKANPCFAHNQPVTTGLYTIRCPRPNNRPLTIVPDEEKEVVRGIFKSLQTIDHQSIQKCKGLEPYDGEPLTPIRRRRQQHEET